MSQRLLITGGSGYLGRYLTRYAVELDLGEVFTTYHANSDQVIAGEAHQLDITDRDAVFDLIRELRPTAIIHTAANNPGHDEALMTPINADGSAFIAEAAIDIGARLVHVSSDTVHDGKHAPYADDAPPAPLNAYGASKAVAEAKVQEIDPAAAIVRTSLIYGTHEIDRGTAGFAKRLESGQPLMLFNDVIRQPVWTHTLSEALVKLTQIDYAGFLNVNGGQEITREAFGRKMLDFWQIETTPDQLQSGRGADISSKIPLDLRADISKGQTLLDMHFHGVDEVLALANQ